MPAEPNRDYSENPWRPRYKKNLGDQALTWGYGVGG